MIQTYSPEHYCIEAAAAQDYEGFYRREMEYRRLLSYPPACVLMTLMVSSLREELAEKGMEAGLRAVKAFGSREIQKGELKLIGPVNAAVYKLNDLYRKILYMKCGNYDILIRIRNYVEAELDGGAFSRQVSVLFDII